MDKGSREPAGLHLAGQWPLWPALLPDQEPRPPPTPGCHQSKKGLGIEPGEAALYVQCSRGSRGRDTLALLKNVSVALWVTLPQVPDPSAKKSILTSRHKPLKWFFCK